MTADTLDHVFRARWSRSTWLGSRKVYIWGLKDNAQLRFRGFRTSDSKCLLPARYMNGDIQGAQYEGTSSPSPVGGDARKGLTIGRARSSAAASGPCTVEAGVRAAPAGSQVSCWAVPQTEDSLCSTEATAAGSRFVGRNPLAPSYTTRPRSTSHHGMKGRTERHSRGASLEGVPAG